MALSPNATNQLFIFHLAQMTSKLSIMQLGQGDVFPWVIDHVTLLPEGPMAMFSCPWPDGKGHASMSLRAEHGKFRMGQETQMHLGPWVTRALRALEARFERSNIELVKLVGRQ